MIGWRVALAIPGFLLLAGCLFDAKSGATSAFGTLWYECLAAGFVLIIPFVYENDRQERLVREAQKRWKAEHPDWKAEAKRNGIYPSWSNVFLGHCHVRAFYLSTAPGVRRPTRAKSIICMSGSRTEIAQKWLYRANVTMPPSPMHEARRWSIQRNPRQPAYCETGRPISGEHLV